MLGHPFFVVLLYHRHKCENNILIPLISICYCVGIMRICAE